MSRPASSSLVALGLGLVAVALVLALGATRPTPSSADDPTRPPHLAYVHVSGEGPQAKAWYDGGPPSGVLVQAALTHFSAQGYRFAALEASGLGSVLQQVVQTGPVPHVPVREPSFVILLQR